MQQVILSHQTRRALIEFWMSERSKSVRHESADCDRFFLECILRKPQPIRKIERWLSELMEFERLSEELPNECLNLISLEECTTETV